MVDVEDGRIGTGAVFGAAGVDGGIVVRGRGQERGATKGKQRRCKITG